MLIHDQLRLAREQTGLSQAKLAALTGLSRNQIVRAEAGENITLDTLRRIMVHLPLQEVTLLERVKIKVDYLNPAEKMFFGLGETLPLLIRATLTVMNLAMVAKTEMAMAQVAEGRTITRRNRPRTPIWTFSSHRSRSPSGLSRRCAKSSTRTIPDLTR